MFNQVKVFITIYRIQKLKKYSLLSKTSSWKIEEDCFVAVAALLEKIRETRLAGIDRENFLIFSRVERVST